MNLRLHRTHDTQEILAVLMRVRDDVWDEEGTPPVPMHETIYHLLAVEERHDDGAVEDRVVGLVSFVPINRVTWNPHLAVVPEARGCGTTILRLGLLWMTENTLCKKVVAMPPAFNAAMIRVFEKCAFTQEGYSPKSFPWRGQLHDRLLLGLEV